MNDKSDTCGAVNKIISSYSICTEIHDTSYLALEDEIILD